MSLVKLPMRQIVFLCLSVVISICNLNAQQITILNSTTAVPIPYAYYREVFVIDTIKTVHPINPLFDNELKTANIHGQIDITKYSDTDTLEFYPSGYHILVSSVGELRARKGKIFLSEKSVDLGEVVVSASRFWESKKDAAMQIEIIKTADISNMNQPTTAEMLTHSGHVFVQKSQLGGGSPVMRGFEASRVLIVVDGVRMNNAIYRAGHLQNVLRIDQNILARTELVFGPSSAIYGSDALGGVMHFITKYPLLASDNKNFHHEGNAFLRYGSAMNEVTGHADISLASKKFGSLTSVTFSRFGNLMQGNNRQPALGNTWDRTFSVQRINGQDSVMKNNNTNKLVGSGYYQYDILQKFMLVSKNYFYHVINIQYSGSSNVNRYDRLTETDNTGTPKSAEWYYGPEKRLLASYQITNWASTPIWNTSRLTIAYQNIEESRHNRNFGAINRTSRIEKLHVASINWDLEKRIKRHEIRYGLEVTFNHVASTAFRTNVNDGMISNTATTRYPGGGSQMYSAAAYLSHTWEIMPSKLILSDAIRFNYVGLRAAFNDTVNIQLPFDKASQNNYALNGNLSLIYMPAKDWRLALIGSTGFRSPNVDDLSKVFDSQPGSVIVPNFDIKPEYSANVDLNISKTFYQKVRVEAVGYFTWLWNAISMQPYQFNGQDSIIYDGVMSRVMANTNSNYGYIAGASFNVDADIHKYFAMEASLGYTYGRLNTAGTWTPLDHVPPVYGRVAAILKLKKFRGEFYTLFNGRKLLKDYSASGEDNLQYATPYGMPGWFTLNLRTSYSVNQYVQIQAGLENILDTRYRYFASGISAPGRNVTVTLRSRF